MKIFFDISRKINISPPKKQRFRTIFLTEKRQFSEKSVYLQFQNIHYIDRNKDFARVVWWRCAKAPQTQWMALEHLNRTGIYFSKTSKK
ncbi:hypothetical protein [Capnocytophaga sp.]|uniref:hypothetical protein n=1 Tax=Capnocytophaga sp. TaxID=44737 RepID=UPI0026DD94CA|nr:hypothetical protein [Capnocytophaga sp.]MDO5105805.1 hypothetical protein [Capnocytophaga sp.]